MFTKSGTFLIGCNYWASHSGTHMWRDWRPDVVSDDMKRLAAAGVQVCRVFPLWPDFQPLTMLYDCNGRPHELRFGEEVIPDTELGDAGISATAMEHFKYLCDAASANGIQLLVGLITGWMSGRWFVPAPFEEKNVLTDPLCLRWEARFVKAFVRYFKDEPAIRGWDLGNECNCLGPLENSHQAYVWTSVIVDAIRSVDRSRPVVSGMHGLKPLEGHRGCWLAADQGELCDILTTHPYPRFTPWCSQDPLDTFRPSLHAVAESLMYSDLGGKPCMVEEIGTLGTIYGNNETAAKYIRQVLFNSWAADLRGLLWWCGFEQIALEQPPYDWHGVERELGMFKLDKTPKPLVGVYQDFRKFLQGLPFEALPARKTDAVCLVSVGQDQWGVAYASYLLARQAGGELSFFDAANRKPLPESSLYFLPSIAGGNFLTRHRWYELVDKVKAGATLYISLDDAVVSEIGDVLGADVKTRSMRPSASAITFDSKAFSGVSFTAPAQSIRLAASMTQGVALAWEENGNPVLTEHTVGKGRIVTFCLPAERILCEQPGTFHDTNANSYWRVYKWLFGALPNHAVEKTSANILVTEHEFTDGRRVVVVVNPSPSPVVETLRMKGAWAPSKALRGESARQVGADTWQVTIPENDAVVLM